jgi:hypothetical protein
MATSLDKATPVVPTFLSDDRQVYHPLDRLRGIIQRYVILEGLLATIIFLVVWYLLAMILDFGVFKALTWDWVQDASWWFRAVALLASVSLLGGIVVFRIVKRLTTEFTYPSLALVLERRFPTVLGDRLITAVELADVEKTAQYGYSGQMIRETIREARERVGTVPVNEVFNWRRLRLMALLAAGLLVGLLLVGFAGHAIATGSIRLVPASWKLLHVSTILVERDLFLLNTPWPRRALLELDDSIPDTGLRVARDGAAPHIKVKSYRWVIADRKVADGWRPLRWSDVTPDRIGMATPELPLALLAYPDEKGELPTEPIAWTVDAIWERARDNPLVREKLSNQMGGENYQALQAAFDRLEELANDPAKGRLLRHLEAPESVSFDYVGARTSGGGPLNSEGKGEYSGEISGLREDVSFVIKAEDYRTPPRAITLIPPPSLIKLSRVERQPVYLHYAPPLVPNPDRPNEMMQLGFSSLKGKLQLMPEEKLSLTGDKSVFVVPEGTEVAITGITELPIAKAYARPKVGKIPGAKPGSAEPVPLKLLDDNTFVIEFKGEARLVSPVEFDLIFENADKVVSVRPILIQVTEDQAPVVEVIPEFIRRVGTFYYVTPRAKIPFNPESSISDDSGLSKVEYTATYWPEDSPIGRAMRCGLVTRMLLGPAGVGNAFPAIIQDTYHAQAFRSLDKGDSRLNATFLVGSFIGLTNQVKAETLDHLDQLLSQPFTRGKNELVKRMGFKSDLRPEANRNSRGVLESFRWRIEGDYFDTRELKLEVPSGDIQPRYQIELNIRASDSNYDTGPKSAANADPIRLLVVSPGDLLYEMSKDEEVLGIKLDEAIKRLESARKKYEFVRSKNGFAPPDEVDAVKVRSKDATQDVNKAKEIIQTITREFRRLEKECIYNQLDEKNIVAYGTFGNRTDRVLGENPFSVSPAEDAEEERRTRAGVPPRPSFPTAEKLLSLVQDALDAGRWADGVTVSDVEITLTGLLRELTDIRQAIGEGESYERVKREVNALVEQQRRVKEELRKWEIFISGVTLQDTPEIAPVGAVFLAKGESQKIKHTIRWRQYKEDNLIVKVTSSDPTGVIVPEELKLDFEKNDLSFDYEIRAANKAGDYTITLTPAVGKKVEMKVTVK